MRNTIKKYKNGGYKALEPKKRGVKKGTNLTLSKRQQKHIIFLLTDHTPEQLKFKFCLWTREVHIAGVNEEEIYLALKLDWNDFEDAVQYSSATTLKADCIVTRNPLDYKESKIPVYTPNEALDFIKSSMKPELKLV